MKLLSKLLIAGLFFLYALSVSAQCVDDEKEAKKLQDQVAKIESSTSKSLEFIERGLKKTPNCFYFYAFRGRVRSQFNSSRGDALADFKKAEELAPLTTSQYWRSAIESYTGSNGFMLKVITDIGNKAYNENINQLCIDAYTLALTYKTTSEYLMGRGDCYYNSKQYESASSDYLQGLDLLSTTDASVSRTLNVVLSLKNISHREKFYLIACRSRSREKEFDRATLDCEEALKIDPNLTEAKEMIASIKVAKVQNKVDNEQYRLEVKLADDRKAVADKLADEKAESDAKNKMAKENPLLFQAYSEAIEKKNYQYFSRILGGREFQCVGCYAPTIKSDETRKSTNSRQTYNFSFFIKFQSFSNGVLDAAFKTRMKYDVKAWARDDPLTYHPGENRQYTLGNELDFGKYAVVSVKGSQLSFETFEVSKINSSLLALLRNKPDLFETMKWDCDCEDPENYYIPASNITESFLNTNEAKITSINYRGKITLQMLDNRGNMQTFVSQ